MDILKQKSSISFENLQNFLKFPYTMIYQKIEKKKNKMHDFQKIKFEELFIRMLKIIELHEECLYYPCSHIRKFFMKFGLIFE